MGIYKEKLSKEDFKIALTECFKKAWIWHNFDNFKQALKWKEERSFAYPTKDQIENEQDFQNDSSAIDLFEVYGKMLDDQSALKELNDFVNAWEDINGFQLAKFLGEPIEDGNEVGDKAKELFELIKIPNKKVYDFSDDTNFNLALTKTQELFVNSISDYEYLFEPAFAYDDQNLRVRVDILKIKENNHVEIIEIKATSKIKKDHFFDLAYQIFVLEKNGLIVDNVCLGHLRDNFILGVEYYPDNLTLAEQARNLFDETPQIEFSEAQEIVKNLDLKQISNQQIDDIESNLENLFDIDPFFQKKTKRNPGVTLIEAYRQLEKDNYLEELFIQLTNLMAMNLSTVEKYFGKQKCETKLKYQPTNSPKNGPQGWKKDESWCFHVVPWFDQNQENVFNFTGASNFSNSKKAQIYWETGLVNLTDIPSLTNLNAQLSEGDKDFFLEHHFRQYDIYQDYIKNPQNFNDLKIIDGYQLSVKRALTDYQTYPIYMYDFETAKWAIPRFNRSKSYQQIPFQFSIDVLLNDDYDYHHPEDTMDHFEFLAQEQVDPRPQFIINFLKSIFSHGPGVYVAYNDAFEKTVLKYLAWAFPEFRIPLLYVVQNTIDLMNFFKGKKDSHPWFMVYHPLFRGSYSIKKTQPALDAAFSYNDLTINRGDKASQTFREYVDDFIPQEVWENQLRKDMIKYCNRDTLAMVVILQRIKEIYQEWEGQNYGKI